MVAQVTQLLSSSVIPASLEAWLALWQGARQGTPCRAASPTEEQPRYVFFSRWAEGAVPKCLDLSRHQHEVHGSPGEADKPGCLTGGCSQCWERMRPIPAAPPRLHPQRGAPGGTAGPLSPDGLRRGVRIPPGVHTGKGVS